MHHARFKSQWRAGAQGVGLLELGVDGGAGGDADQLGKAALPPDAHHAFRSGIAGAVFRADVERHGPCGRDPLADLATGYAGADRVDHAGAVQRGPLADLAMQSSHARLLLVAPGESITLHPIPLPSRNRATWARAVPYALEDHLADVENKISLLSQLKNEIHEQIQFTQNRLDALEEEKELK